MKLHNALNILLLSAFGCFVACIECGFYKNLTLLTNILAFCIFCTASIALGRNVISSNKIRCAEVATTIKYAFWATVSFVYILRQTIYIIQ